MNNLTDIKFKLFDFNEKLNQDKHIHEHSGNHYQTLNSDKSNDFFPYKRDYDLQSKLFVLQDKVKEELSRLKERVMTVNEKVSKF